jgi:hypothetical protein
MLTALHVSACRFSLPEQKIGALFNEKFKKTSHTVENTHAHNLRLEIAAKLVEKFGSVERAFEHYTEGDAGLGDRAVFVPVYLFIHACTPKSRTATLLT